jgi:GNAT superfamily N-acetyltransferase
LEPSRRELELNEVRWWSNWARLRWLGPSAYLLTSDRLREPFFNRAGALACKGVERTVAMAEKWFARLGMGSTFMVFDSCAGAAAALEDSGYRPVDTMAVLLSRGPIADESATGISVNSRPSAGSWTRAYLESFYGGQELAPSVAPIVRRLPETRGVTLLEATIDHEAAGVLALFRTEGLAGVYCVGTVPRRRRLGVAATLLARAKEMADAEGRSLVLQSLASDGSERYYLDRGFVNLYTKLMYARESSNAVEKKRA